MTSEINQPPITPITEQVDYISSCPTEVLIPLFKFLDLASLFSAQRVCKRFQEVVKSDPIWLHLAQSVGVDLENSHQAQDRLFHRIKVIHAVARKLFPNDAALVVSGPNLLLGFTATVNNLLAKFTRGNEFNDAVNTHNVDIIRATARRGFAPNGNSIKLAIDSGKSSVIKEVLSHPCKPSKLSVSAAIASLNLEIIRMVLAQKPDQTDCSLNDAIKTGDLDIVRMLLDFGATPDHQSVSIAFKEGNEFVKEILNHGGKPDDDSVNLAIKTRDLGLLELVFSKGGKANEESVTIAFATQDAEIIKNVLSHKAKPDDQGVNTAIKFGDLEILEMIFDNGGVPDDQSVSLALEQGLKFVEKVLKHGGIPNNTLNTTPGWETYRGDVDSIILESEYWGNEELVRMAFENGGKPSEHSIGYALETENQKVIKLVFANAARLDGACNAAIKTGNSELVGIVLDNGGKPDAQSIDLALQTSNSNIIRMILAQGIQPDRKHLSTAIGTRDPAIVKTILAHGVTPDEQSLSDAIKTDSKEVVEVLLDYEAEPSAKNVHKAVKNNKLEIAQMLAAQILKIGLQFTVRPREFNANDAIQIGNIEFLRQVLAHGGWLDRESLSLAVKSRNLQMVKMVLDKVASIQSFFTFDHALETGDLDIVRIVFSKWNDYKQSESSPMMNRIDLRKAVRTGSPAIVKIALDAGAELTCWARGHYSGEQREIREAYSETLKANNLEIIKMVTLKVAKDGDDVLDQVVEFNDIEVFQIFMSNYTKAIAFNFAYLDIATKKENREIIKIIATAVAKSNPNKLDKFLAYQDSEILQIFFENGGKITVAEWKSIPRTLLTSQAVLNTLALYMAKSGEKGLNSLIDFGNPEAVQVYLENGGVSSYGPTPSYVDFQYALSGKNEEVASKVVVALAKSGTDSFSFMNSLNEFIKHEDLKWLQLYVANGKPTPDVFSLPYAIKTGNVEIVKIVKELGGEQDEARVADALKVSKNPEILMLFPLIPNPTASNKTEKELGETKLAAASIPSQATSDSQSVSRPSRSLSIKQRLLNKLSRK